MRSWAAGGVFALAIASLGIPAMAQLSVRDDLNRPVQVKKKPGRIVTLAPFLTELVFAAGAGDQVIAVRSSPAARPRSRSTSSTRRTRT